MSNERTEAHANLVLVTGATGRQGGAVAHQLLKAGIPVRALTRSPGSESARQLAAAGAEIVTGDMSVADTLDAALDGVATVFSVQDFYAKDAGYDGEVAQGTNLARAAKCAGVAHYVQSTMAATSDPGDVDHFRSKFAIERIVESFDLPYTFVGTVWFMDNVSDPKNGGKLTFPALNGTLAPAAKFHMLCIEDLGAAVSRIIIERDRHLGRRIDLAGDVLTLPELKASYTEASGRHPKRWAIPNLMLRMFARDFAAQLRWHNRVGWSFGTDGLRGLVPDATDFGHYVARHEVANL